MKFRTRSSAIIGTLCLVTSLALATASAVEPADPVKPASASLTEVARAQGPSAGAAGPDDTLWIAERAGTVRVLDDQGLGAPVLDISDETTTDGERGLLGVAFDKTFAHFYISFTDLEGTSTVDEFAVEVAAPAGYPADRPHPDPAVREPQRRGHQIRPRRLPVHRVR